MERGEAEGSQICQVKIYSYKRMCWPANTVGAFFVALLLIDIYQKKYTDLPYHAVYGVAMTFLFWLICNLAGESISGGVLIIPAVFLSVFLFTVWFIDESIKNRGCCMNCGGDCQKTCKKGHLVKKAPIDSTVVPGTSLPGTSSLFGLLGIYPVTQCNNTLTATHII